MLFTKGKKEKAFMFILKDHDVSSNIRDPAKIGPGLMGVLFQVEKYIGKTT